MAEWVIEIRLGRRPDAKPLRQCVVEATSEADALRQVLAQAQSDADVSNAGLLQSGQEEVFARSEVDEGRIEHHAGEEDAPNSGAEPMLRPAVDRP